MKTFFKTIERYLREYFNGEESTSLLSNILFKSATVVIILLMFSVLLFSFRIFREILPI